MTAPAPDRARKPLPRPPPPRSSRGLRRSTPAGGGLSVSSFSRLNPRGPLEPGRRRREFGAYVRYVAHGYVREQPRPRLAARRQNDNLLAAAVETQHRGGQVVGHDRRDNGDGRAGAKAVFLAVEHR